MPDNQEMIPVYLFVGFLEAGKTRFVQEALSDERFATGERTLLLVCEDGEEEYDIRKIPQKDVYLHIIEDAFELTPENLKKLADECRAERVVIEYNGMWMLNDLFEAMPEDWGVYQAVMVADASTFLNYNANMRSLVVDKLNVVELVYFNRLPRSADFQPYHQIVRGISRQTEIYYEYEDGQTVVDDIEDPLPFDTEADEIVLEDRDFALWFRDLMEDPRKYSGKTMTFRALAVKNPSFPKNVFAVGRHIMTCCVEDIKYCWIPAEYAGNFRPRKNHWIMVTGKIAVRMQVPEQHPMPVLTVTALHDADPPEQEVATFY